MTPEELRRWSAELQGWTKVLGVDKAGAPCYYWAIKTFRKMKKVMSCKDWTPDLDTAPAWQIKAVIEAMRELGWWLIFDGGKCGPYYAEFKSSGSKRLGYQGELNPWLAILLAAHAAWVEVRKCPTSSNPTATNPKNGPG